MAIKPKPVRDFSLRFICILAAIGVLGVLLAAIDTIG
jgi:hypothetical protein